jgi:hypothetical protein
LEVKADSVVGVRQLTKIYVMGPGHGGELKNVFLSRSNIEMCEKVCRRLDSIVACINGCLDLSKVQIVSTITDVLKRIYNALTVQVNIDSGGVAVGAGDIDDADVWCWRGSCRDRDVCCGCVVECVEISVGTVEDHR